jgi:hypothetical protein
VKATKCTDEAYRADIADLTYLHKAMGLANKLCCSTYSGSQTRRNLASSLA